MGNNVMLLKRHHTVMAASSPKLATVSGTQSVSLPKAVSMPLKSLKIEGSSTLSATPTPSTPATITTNYGSLTPERYELPAEYQYIDGITFSGRTYYEISDLYLTGADTVRLSFSFTTNCNVFGCYDSDVSDSRYSLYVSSSSGAKYMRYNDEGYDSYFPQSARGDRFDVVITPTGTSGMYTDSTWTAQTFTSPVAMRIGLTGPGVTSTKFSGNMYGCFIVEGRFKGIPCIRKSDNNIGYYDTYSKQFYAPIGSNPSALEIGNSTITFGNNTIEAAELLAVGDYKDEQDIISGDITRRVGVKVFDGTENWTINVALNTNRFRLPLSDAISVTDRYQIICSHFGFAGSGQVEGICFIYTGTPTLLYFIPENNASFSTVEDWTSYLATQYAAGTPVIVLYPLATETTEYQSPTVLQTILNAANTITTTNNIVVQYWKKPF